MLKLHRYLEKCRLAVPVGKWHEAVMRFVLLVLSLLAFGNGCYIGLSAQSSIHQIYAAAQMLIAAVLFGAAAICSEIVGLRKCLADGRSASPEPNAARVAPLPVDSNGSKSVWIAVALLAGGTVVLGFTLAYAKSRGWIS